MNDVAFVRFIKSKICKYWQQGQTRKGNRLWAKRNRLFRSNLDHSFQILAANCFWYFATSINLLHILANQPVVRLGRTLLCIALLGRIWNLFVYKHVFALFGALTGKARLPNWRQRVMFLTYASSFAIVGSNYPPAVVWGLLRCPWQSRMLGTGWSEWNGQLLLHCFCHLLIKTSVAIIVL